MYDLDFNTVRFIASIIVMGTLLSLVGFWGKREFRLGTNYWLQGIVFFAASFFLFLIRKESFITLVNTLMASCLLASSMWFYYGTSAMVGSRPHVKLGTTLLLILTSLIAAIHTFNLNILYAIGINALSIALLSFLSALLLLRHQWREGKLAWRTPEFGSAVIFLWYGCYHSTQLFYVIAYPVVNFELLDLWFLGNSLFISALTITFTLTAYHLLEIQVAELIVKTEKLQLKREEHLQNRWLLALENAKAGAWELNLTLNTMKVSKQAAAMLDISHDDYEITLASSLSRLHSEDRDHYLLDLQEIRDGISNTLNREHRLLKSDGSYIWVACLGKVIKDEEKPEQLIISGTNTDITEAKEIQSKLESAIVEAQGARVAAIKASKAKSTFLANISHEIRTPMNAIMGFSQLLMDDKSLSTKQRENLEIITSSSQHLLALIEDVLNLSRIESGHLSIQPTGVDPNIFFQELSIFFQKRPHRQGVTFQADISSEWPGALNFDPKCVRQVCFNLLSNAFKFTNSGTVFFRASSIQHASDQIDLLIEVSDTGIGISQEEQKVIFDAFVQSSQGATLDGYGLGLSICKGLITQMGGTISLKSTLQEGSHFTVTLPVTIAKVTEQITPTYDDLPGHQALTKQLTLLIVDDIDSNRKLLMRLLENSGYHILEAANAKKALEIMEKKLPDLVLMDIRMPIMNGDEALRKMRKTPSLATIPVIAITANALEGEKERLLAIGAAAFISKPFSRTEIFQTIIRVLHTANKTQAEPLELKSTHLIPSSREEFQIETAITPSILAVDDNKANLQLLTSQLKHLGLTADVAHDGEEGYKMFISKRYDLVFSDCHMPVLDGFELASRIRHFEIEQQLSHHTIIIAITGSPEEFRTKCFQCGMDDVIGKPLLLNTLKLNLKKFNLL